MCFAKWLFYILHKKLLNISYVTHESLIKHENLQSILIFTTASQRYHVMIIYGSK
jgi:hypothetical protein